MNFFTQNSSGELVALELESQDIGSGNEATIYPIKGSDQVAKIFHEEIEMLSIKCKIMLLESLLPVYVPCTDLLEIVAFPTKIILDENKQIFGYIMRSCQGWQDFSQIIKLELRERIWAFCCLHKALQTIHKYGFVVGDFNPDNVMFKIDKEGCQVCFIDTDSWSYPPTDLQAQVIKPTQAQHPELYQAIVEKKALPAVKAKHDWWSFTYLLFCYLTDYNPFTGGQFDADGEAVDYEDRILKGAVLKYPSTKLELVESQKICCLGSRQLHACNRILTTRATGEYPRWLLVELYQHTIPCANCGQEVNHQIDYCPYCATVL